MITLRFCSVLLFLVASTVLTSAQSGMPQIPEDAFFVARISGSSLTSKMSIDQLNELAVFQDMFRREFKGAEISTFQEMGVDLNKDVFMYVEHADSITYMTWMFPLSDLESFKNVWMRELRIDPEAGSPQMKNEVFIYWNDKAATFTVAYMHDRYSNEYGAYPDEYDEAVQEEILYEREAIYDDIEAVEMPPPPPPSSEDLDIEEIEIVIEETGNVAEPAQTVEEVVEEQYEVEEIVAPDFEYNDRYSRGDDLMYKWQLARLERMKSTMGKGPVLSSKRHASVAASKADGSMFLDYGSVKDKGLFNLLDAYFRSEADSEYELMRNVLGGYTGTSFHSDLNFGDRQITWESDVVMGASLAKTQKKVMSGKMNKKYLQYMNDDALIGYYAMHVETGALLQSYSEQLSIAGDDTTQLGGAMSLVGELLALVLDEEEIAEFLPGSMVMTFSDFERHLIEYTTYEYDDNFERTPVTREREQIMPMFMAMVETGRPDLVNKLIRLAMKERRAGVKETELGFELAESPIPVMFFTKGDMFFIGNDADQLRQVKNGAFKSGLNAKHKKAIGKNNLAVFFDGKALLDDMAAVFQTGRQSDYVSFLQGKAENVMITSKMKNSNTYSSQMVIELPDGEQNGWAYLLNLINRLYEFDKEQY